MSQETLFRQLFPIINQESVDFLFFAHLCYQPGGKLARHAFGYQSLCTLYLGVLLECQSAIEWRIGWSIGQGSRLKWQ